MVVFEEGWSFIRGRKQCKPKHVSSGLVVLNVRWSLIRGLSRGGLLYEVLQVSHCQHQCHYCYLSAASSINKTAEAYSKVNRMLFNDLSNYHYLLTKKKNYSSFLNTCCYLTWDSCYGLIIFCRGCMCTSKLPEKA